MKTQLNMWVYEEDAAAIRAKAAREDMPIGEYITRAVLGRDPAHPPRLEDRVERLERLTAFDAEDFERFRTDPKNQAILDRIFGDEEAC